MFWNQANTSTDRQRRLWAEKADLLMFSDETFWAVIGGHLV